MSFEVLNIYPLSVPDCLPSRVVDRSELTVLGLEVWRGLRRQQNLQRPSESTDIQTSIFHGQDFIKSHYIGAMRNCEVFLNFLYQWNHFVLSWPSQSTLRMDRHIYLRDLSFGSHLIWIRSKVWPKRCSDALTCNDNKLRSVLILAPWDNVIVACQYLEAVEIIEFEEYTKIFLRKQIPIGYKIAVDAIKASEKTIKFWVPIGSATTDVSLRTMYIHTIWNLITFLPTT